jgi:hypothetical protein
MWDMHLLYVCFNSGCNSNKFQFIFQLFGLAGRAFLNSYLRTMRTTLHESSISSLMKKNSKEIKKKRCYSPQGLPAPRRFFRPALMVSIN